jgi:RES domain-containing protein
MPTRELIEAVDGIARSPIAANVIRHVAPGYRPLSGEGARIHGGRWNPPDSFAVLYTAFDRLTMKAELERAARRQGLLAADFLPRDEVTHAVELQRVLDLVNASNLRAVDLDPGRLASMDWADCQAVGDAAHYVGFEGIMSPSATGAGTILAIFLDRLLLGSILDVVSIAPLALEPGESR